MIYEFMEDFNLTFKLCQLTVIKHKDLIKLKNKFQTDFQNDLIKFNYKNNEIYNIKNFINL